MSERFSKLAAPGLAGLSPYVPGKPAEQLERELGIRESIKLASNENPLGPGPRALQAMARALPSAGLYPDGTGHALRARLSQKHGVDPAQVTLGNGSNDVLVLLAEAFLTPAHEAVYSQYCFAVYPLACQAVGAIARVASANPPSHAMPLGHDLQAMHGLIGPDTRLVFVANPNNPTGTWLEEGLLRDFLGSLPGHVIAVVDEAYTEYASGSGCADATAWLERFPNLVVCRTFSKAYGLAGLRVGYALSDPGVADLLNRIRQPFNVNSVALAGALAALDDEGHLQATLKLNRQGMRQLRDGLQALGFAVLPSACNFLLCDFGRPAAPINEALLRQGVIVRPVGNYGLPNHLRISIGTSAQNQRLLEALSSTLSGGT